MNSNVYQVWVGDIFYGSFPTQTQAEQYAQQLRNVNPNILTDIREGKV